MAAKKRNPLDVLSRKDLLKLISHAIDGRKQAIAEDPPPTKAGVDWTKVQKRCPHCKETKPVVPDFGTKPDRDPGTRKPQSWCNRCRATTHYYSRLRKYAQRMP